MASLFKNSLKSQNTVKFVVNSITQRTYAADAKLVSVEVNDKSGIATVSIQKPPVNSLSLELITELNSVLTELTKSKCRGMILTTNNPKVFSAGLDIMEMYKPNPDRVKQFWTGLQDLWLNLYGSSYPTAAAIVGHAPAGGCLLSLSCEYRVMAPNCAIGLNETQLGLIAPGWFTDSMLNVIGPRQTEMALTQGRMFTTGEALEIGLIDEIGSSREDIITKCDIFLNKYQRIPKIPRFASKMNVRGPAIQRLQKGKQQDLQQFLDVVNNPATQKMLDMYLQSLKKK